MEYSISHYNGKRNADELVIYNTGESTHTNKYGFEVSVDSNGDVTLIGGNNHTIPKGGFVVSAHGKAAIFISYIVCKGAKISIDGNTQNIIINVSDEARTKDYESRINKIKERALLINDGNKEKLFQIIHQAEDLICKKDFPKAEKLLESAYYLSSQSNPQEVRAVWHRPLEKSEEEVEATVIRFANAGFNLMLIETNYGGYANALRCAAEYLPPRSDFDVIDAFIRHCKKHKMQIHAWYENYFVGYNGAHCAMLEKHPNLIAKRKDGGILLDAEDRFYFLNPALPEVREFLTKSCKQLLDNYDFDGLQLDYIRYPFIRDIDHAAGFDDYTKSEFLKDTGIDIEQIKNTDCSEWIQFTHWCANQVTMYVEMIHSLISQYRAKGRNIQLSTAVIGNPEDAIHKKCQDWRFWVEQGWLDAIYPMAYYNDADEVLKEITFMVENYKNTPNISGIAPLYNKLPNIEATKQVEACRKGGAKGISFFAAESFSDECLETLEIGVFRNREK